VKSRADCGWLGITRDQCTQFGCCYDDTIPGVRWCFYSSAGKLLSTARLCHRAPIFAFDKVIVYFNFLSSQHISGGSGSLVCMAHTLCKRQ